MEKIDPSNRSSIPIKPDAHYIEKLIDIKIVQATESALKQLKSENSDRVTKNLRFDHVVVHKQTYGKVSEDGTYQVEVKITKLPLVDEEDPEDKIWTKEDLIEVEKAIETEKQLLASGLEQNPEEVEALNKAEKLLERLETLFDGRNSLPFKLRKPTPRDYQRMDISLSSGHLTETLRKTKIVDSMTPSWPKDLQKEEALNQLHDRAIAKIKGKLTTTKMLVEKMLELRKFDHTVTLTKEEVYNLYLDFDRKKERFLPPQIREQVANTTDVNERMRILKEYYHENLLPLESETEVDLDQIKEFLEENMDLVFKDESLEVTYSSISDRDIIKFIQKKYKLKS